MLCRTWEGSIFETPSPLVISHGMLWLTQEPRQAALLKGMSITDIVELHAMENNSELFFGTVTRAR